MTRSKVAIGIKAINRACVNSLLVFVMMYGRCFMLTYKGQLAASITML